jgi:PIN domain nuclease of toxin-antitoxin system
VRFLLDTHSFLWFIGGDKRLPLTARQLVADIDNEVFLSVVSLWEIAIKVSLKKLTLSKPFDELIPRQLAINEITILPIDFDALNLMIGLPFHHRDPFDRLLIAQATSQKLPIISKDAAFVKYPVDVIWQNQPD